uniref:TOG domain-containing protein n=1 Tax=Hanusia phi TaxID=3032 RepID=A0A7S0EVE1_9CRYP|mmetsp:Transcript_32141/g.72181  ORF Transcript_32141/g.72181 Transcript_32141/m.72181 type:complete len:634 (+) Transcript_32141:84-1985(+)
METEGFVTVEDKAAKAAEEDEVDDEEWTDLERFQNFVISQHPLRRLVCVRGLPDLVSSLDIADVIQLILQPLQTILKDGESSVRDALAANLAPIVRNVMEKEKLTDVEEFVEGIWSVSFPLIMDQDQQVRAVAEDGVIEYMALIPEDLVKSVMLESILRLVEQDSEDDRITGMKILGEMSFKLGHATVQSAVGPKVINLAEDSMFRVRKAAALYIGKVSRWGSRDYAVNVLLPVYLKLADDEIWGVRKACADSLADMAASITSEMRGKHILPLFDKLATDVSRWVRNAAFQHLGPLIATLSSEEVTPKLLQYYSSMATGKGQSVTADHDLPTFCAYNFPAVVMTVGKENWVHLQEAYHELINDIQWKVRRSLSYSIHEIALILGPDLTQESLLPALDTFLQDLDEVKVGVLQNLAKFFRVLDPSMREKYVSVLCNIEMETYNWRFRLLLAQQLGELFTLYQEEIVKNELYPMFMKLCRDPVAEVRNASCNQIDAILDRLDELKVDWRDEFMEELHDLATDRSFQHRLMFAQMCAVLLASNQVKVKMFETDFLNHLLALAEDKVANVRQKTGECFKIMGTLNGFSNEPRIQGVIKALKNDTDIEVLRTMGIEMDIGTTAQRHSSKCISDDAEIK